MKQAQVASVTILVSIVVHVFFYGTYTVLLKESQASCLGISYERWIGKSQLEVDIAGAALAENHFLRGCHHEAMPTLERGGKVYSSKAGHRQPSFRPSEHARHTSEETLQEVTRQSRSIYKLQLARRKILLERVLSDQWGESKVDDQP